VNMPATQGTTANNVESVTREVVHETSLLAGNLTSERDSLPHKIGG